jgi:probable F420-dependent oxidoreductase
MHPVVRKDAMPPTLGVFLMNAYACADPVVAARVAGLAEGLGYESLWVADHVVLPHPRVDPSPMDPTDPLLDPIVALTHLAAHTERMALGTGCVILPQRNPLVLAKQLASLDIISGGRLIFGLAAGYLEPELRAVGVPMAGRGARADEYLAAMRTLWYDDEPAFHGDHVDFAGVHARPRPLQRPIPVVVGGHSPAAHRRAVQGAGGWFGFLLGLRAAAAQLSALRTVSAESGRQGEPLHVSVAPSRPLDPDVVRAYADLGVDRLIMVPPTGLSPPHRRSPKRPSRSRAPLCCCVTSSRRVASRPWRARRFWSWPAISV